MAVVNKNPVKFVCGTFASRYREYVTVSELEAEAAKLKAASWYDAHAAGPHGEREFTEKEKQIWQSNRN